MNPPIKKYGVLGVAYSAIAHALTAPAVRLRIDPNAITIVGFCVFTLGVGALLAPGLPMQLVGVVMIQIGIMLDYLDGMVARIAGKQSFFGSWLDNTLDRVSDFLIVLAVTIKASEVHPIDRELLALGLVAVFVTIIPQYMYDIEYYYRMGKRSSNDSLSLSTYRSLLRKISTYWRGLFNRDTFVLMSCIGIWLGAEIVVLKLYVVLGVVATAILFARATLLPEDAK